RAALTLALIQASLANSFAAFAPFRTSSPTSLAPLRISSPTLPALSRKVSPVSRAFSRPSSTSSRTPLPSLGTSLPDNVLTALGFASGGTSDWASAAGADADHSSAAHNAAAARQEWDRFIVLDTVAPFFERASHT